MYLYIICLKEHRIELTLLSRCLGSLLLARRYFTLQASCMCHGQTSWCVSHGLVMVDTTIQKDPRRSSKPSKAFTAATSGHTQTQKERLCTLCWLGGVFSGWWAYYWIERWRWNWVVDKFKQAIFSPCWHPCEPAKCQNREGLCHVVWHWTTRKAIPAKTTLLATGNMLRLTCRFACNGRCLVLELVPLCLAGFKGKPKGKPPILRGSFLGTPFLAGFKWNPHETPEKCFRSKIQCKSHSS